jgi:hypothetical protein
MDLFQQFDALFQGKSVDAPPYPIVLNRWLSSDPDFARVARQLQGIYDAKMIWELWIAILPRAAGAPRLKYPAPTKPKAVEQLVDALMKRENLRRSVAEMYVDTINPVHRAILCHEYGIKVEGEDEPKSVTTAQSGPTGILGFV